MATRLTVMAVEKTKAGTSRQEIPDGGCPGLYLIVQPSGAKGWAIRCRVDGKPTKVTLGPYPRLDLTAARDQARNALALVDRGIDPRQDRAEQRQTQSTRRANTVRAVAEQFCDRHLKRVRLRTWKQSWSELDRFVLARLGDRPITSIRRRDLHEILDGLADKPGSHHHVLSVTNSMFRWAADREIIETNPADRLPRLKPGVRERALTDDEVPIVWNVAGSLNYPHAPLVRLLLLTGCRRSEIGGLRWSEIDLDQNIIVVPAVRYKTGRALVVPISSTARRLIDDLPRHAGGDYVFSVSGGQRPVTAYSRMMERLDAALVKHCEDEGREPFNFDLHDLRRTLRTGLSALRVPPHIAEQCLGHSVRGVQRHYDKHSYIDEKREALEIWARKVESLVAPGGNVVAMCRPPGSANP